MSELCFSSFPNFFLHWKLNIVATVFLRSQASEAKLWFFLEGILKYLRLWKEEQNFSCCGSAKPDNVLSQQLVSVLGKPWAEWLQIFLGNKMLAVTIRAINALWFCSDSRSQVLSHIKIQYLLNKDLLYENKASWSGPRFCVLKVSQSVTSFQQLTQKKDFFSPESLTL